MDIKKSTEYAPCTKGLKHMTLANLPEDEECQLYTLMCIKSTFMLKKFVERWGDAGRRLLVSVKYRLSNCPHTYLMIRDLVQDSNNWEIEYPPMLSTFRVIFSDKRNGTTFTLYNNSRGLKRVGYGLDRDYDQYSKFAYDKIKLSYNNQSEMFNSNEKVIVAKVLMTHQEMLKNYEELKRQQRIQNNSDKLRGLY